MHLRFSKECVSLEGRTRRCSEEILFPEWILEVENAAIAWLAEGTPPKARVVSCLLGWGGRKCSFEDICH